MGQIPGAGVDLEHPIAHRAAEMVVVPVVGGFVAGGGSRDLHRMDGALVQPLAQGPVHRGDPQPGYAGGRRLQQFPRGKRPAGPRQGPFDGEAFPRVPGACILAHGGSVAVMETGEGWRIPSPPTFHRLSRPSTS